MNGKAVPKGQEPQTYWDILSSPRFGSTKAQSEDFRQFVRNGVIHDAETRKGWLVEKTVPRDAITKKNSHGDYVLNRTKFHKALEATFGDWIAKLRAGDADLRKKMRARMDQIIAKHYAP
jgi:hypothetical protein